MTYSSEHQGPPSSNRHTVRPKQPAYSECCWAERWPGSEMSCNHEAASPLGLCEKHLEALKERAAVQERRTP